jgi:hypothetical protein
MIELKAYVTFVVGEDKIVVESPAKGRFHWK